MKVNLSGTRELLWDSSCAESNPTRTDRFQRNCEFYQYPGAGIPGWQIKVAQSVTEKFF